MVDSRFTPAQVIHALTESGGVALAAAMKLGCEREVVISYIEEDPQVQAALAEIGENTNDMAEVAFLKALQSGEQWAVREQLARAAPRRTDTRVRGPDGRFPRRPQIESWGDRFSKLKFPEGATKKEKELIRRQRADLMEEIIADVAANADHPETRASAASKLHAIYQGSPLQRNLNLNVDAEEVDVGDLDDGQLEAELARLRGTGADPT